MKDIKQGDRVRLTYDPDASGTVLRSGPEVSEVRLDAGGERFFPNTHLRPDHRPRVRKQRSSK